MLWPTLTLWVPGRPLPQLRPRRGAAGQFYTPDSGYQAQVAAAWIGQYGRNPIPAGTPVRVCITFALKGEHPGTMISVETIPEAEGVAWWPKRPDLDNLSKAVLDALGGHTGRRQLGGLAWADDSQVVQLETSKREKL